MAWVSPTGHNDPLYKWTDDAYAWDNDIGTFAYNHISKIGYYLELTLTSAINCDKIQIYCADSPTDPLDCDIDVYYSDNWYNIHSGMISDNIWVEKTIGSTQSVDKARVKVNSLAGVDQVGLLYEFDFWEVEAPPPTYIPKVIMVT